MTRDELAGQAVETESAVNLPNWLDLRFAVGDADWVGLADAAIEVEHQRVELDLRRGVLNRRLTVRDGDGRRTSVHQRRFVDMARSYLAALHTVVTELTDGVGTLPAPEAMLVLRTSAFHLLQTVSPHSVDLDAGVPARGLHGEAYRGHDFWDELFVLPVLTLRPPVLARSLLRYRTRRLDAARRAARAAGHTGPCSRGSRAATGARRASGCP